MKIRYTPIGLFLYLTLLSSCKTNPAGYGVIENIQINEKIIPKIHLEQIADSASTIKLSEIFGDFRIIPLETSKECLISYPSGLCLTGQSIITWTQVGMGPCRVLEFDLNGKFIREIGRGGKGPGEHVGYCVEEMSWFPDKEEILVSFCGMGDENQLFDKDGSFLRTINVPVELTQGIKRFNDTLWMTPGSIAGTTQYRRDSIRLIQYTAEGKEIKVWPRIVYPPSNQTGYSPNSLRNSLYQHKGHWQIYSPGDDTLYRIFLDRLDPIAILDPGPKGQRYNEFVDPSRVVGTHLFKVVKETDARWFIEKWTIAQADLHGSGNSWSGSFNTNEFFLTIDKKSGEGRNVRFTDDFLGILPESSSRLPVQWTGQGEPFLSFIAVELKVSIRKTLLKEDLDPEIRSRLEQLDKQVTDDSNPVIITMQVIK